MKVTLSEDQTTLTVELSVSPRPSKSGKTTVIATSGGNQKCHDVLFDGQPVTVGVNAYIPKVERPERAEGGGFSSAKQPDSTQVPSGKNVAPEEPS